MLDAHVSDTMQEEKSKMKLYFTSDTHSYIYPTDYIHEGIMDMGYAHLSSAFEEGAVIIDGGDVLQGSPLIRYALMKGEKVLPPALAFNAAGLDVYVPGNHDFDFGYETLLSLLSALDADAVCANLSDGEGRLPVRRHAIIERNGIRLFVTGAVTDYVNVWNGGKLGKLSVTDSVEALRAEAEAMRSIPHDYSICVYHGGFGEEEGPLRENRAGEIASLGFDFLLTAHQHQVIGPLRIGKTTVLQAGWRGEWAAELDLRKDASDVRLIRCSASTPLSERMEAFLRSYALPAEAERSLYAVTGTVDGILEDRGYVESALCGSSLADFINDLQLGLTGADVSAASLANNFVSIGPDVTLASVLASYPFSNNLTLLEMSAGELRKAMERSAEYIDSVDGVPSVSPSFAPGKNERYNFDFYRGLAYSFDYRRAKGERVVRMEQDGIDLLSHPETILRVVVNSYRATGTGGYPSYRNSRVIRRYSEEMQDVLSDALSRKGVKVPPPTDFSAEY